MELILKSAAAALTAAIIALVIKRGNPELATALSLCTLTVIMTAVLGFASGLRDFMDEASKLANTSGIYISSVLKCLAAAIITKLASELCRDSGQAALAASVDFAGSICALALVLPLISSMLKLIGEMV